MQSSLRTDSAQLRAKAFEQFKKVAQAEQPNGAENLALFRLVPQFSTAPKIETEEIAVCMRHWSRTGNAAALLQHGSELYNWSRENGYHHG